MKSKRNNALHYVERFLKFFYIVRFKRHQWATVGDLKTIQEKRLRKIVRYAYENVPFYKNLFDYLYIKPSDVCTIEDLKKISIITKEQVQKNFPDKILPHKISMNECIIFKTTGSTGIPLKICFNYKGHAYRKALMDYIFLESGVRWNESITTIRHYPSNNDMSKFRKIRFLIRKNISLFEPVEKILDELIKRKPTVIYTYPSILSILANKIREKNIRSIKPRLLFTIGEPLTNGLKKELFNTFGCEVIGIYGSEEFGGFAFECKHSNGYHVISDAVILEVVKEENNFETNTRGEVVVTGLYNNVMPLIRYNLGDIGDIVSFSSNNCSCGRRYPLIKSIDGRTDDFLILPSGKKISPRAINVIEDISGISMYRIIQETKSRFVVNLVKGKGFSEKTIVEIKNRILAGCLGENVAVEVNAVNELPRNRRGKLRTIISKVND